MKRYVRRLLSALLLVLMGCDRDAPLPAPSLTPGRTLTVVALGDSLTEGMADTPGGGGYPARLERLLNGVHPGTQIVNLGRSGWTSAQLVKRQLPTAVAIKPDIVLVWIGSNDLWRYYRAEQEAQDLKDYTANLDTILSTLSDDGRWTMGPELTKDRSQSSIVHRPSSTRVFVALLDDQSKRPVAHTTEIEPYTQDDRDRMSRRAAAYNAAITDKAAEYGATTVDFNNTTIFTDPSTLATDGNHPNANGYDVIAQMWFEAIRPTLRP